MLDPIPGHKNPKDSSQGIYSQRFHQPLLVDVICQLPRMSYYPCTPPPSVSPGFLAECPGSANTKVAEDSGQHLPDMEHTLVFLFHLGGKPNHQVNL